MKHPKYSYLKKKNDIALIELKGRVYFSDCIKPACLYTNVNDLDSTIDLTIAGWGFVSPECK